MSGEPLAIAQVTPFAWEVGGDVNAYVARVSDELTRRGHRVLIIAPSQSDALVRDSRRAIRSQPEELLARAESEPLVLGVGEVLPFSPARRRAASIPVDVARTIEQALTSLALDIVDVHEPFAPSASAVALRHSRALNVGGNMDFYNMLERERLESKKISKTNAVTSIMGHELPPEDVHVGPSDYVPWLTDRKWAHIRLEGQAFGDVPLAAELKLEVWDSPNAAGNVIDAVQCC